MMLQALNASVWSCFCVTVWYTVLITEPYSGVLWGLTGLGDKICWSTIGVVILALPTDVWTLVFVSCVPRASPAEYSTAIGMVPFCIGKTCMLNFISDQLSHFLSGWDSSYCIQWSSGQVLSHHWIEQGTALFILRVRYELVKRGLCSTPGCLVANVSHVQCLLASVSSISLLPPAGVFLHQRKFEDR